MITQLARHALRRLLVTLSIGVAAIQVLATPARGEESLPPPTVPEQGEWAKTAPLPVPDSSLLAPVTLGYRIRIAPPGRAEMTMEGTQTLTKGELEGRPVWRITTVTQPPMGGQSTAVFELDMASLSPLRRSVTQGSFGVTLQFTDEAVTGTMAFPGQEIPVDVALDAPVFGDDAALQMVLGSLPLKPGYRTTFRTFDPQMQQVRVWSLEVTGVETIEVAAGVFEALTTELEALDGAGGRGTMWFASKSPRVVVRSVFERRGVTITSELTSRE